ncbi:MAG: hypothetical protein HYY63_04100 [Elusimicrobia bacterium]|nr:hypothetical protein [Elusimicrobiota bacterium]
MNDRKELISKYFADISKIVIAAAVIQPLTSSDFDTVEIAIGVLVGTLLLVSAIFVLGRRK